MSIRSRAVLCRSNDVANRRPNSGRESQYVP
jgi:hypothetical protein